MFVAGRSIAVVRWRGRVFAVRNVCPHQSQAFVKGVVRPAAVSERAGEIGYDEDRPVLACPCHHFQFELGTGKCLVDPALRIKAYRVEVESGKVFLDLGDRSEAGDRRQQERECPRDPWADQRPRGTGPHYNVGPIMGVADLFDLSGRVALVTGGGKGLGRQMAEGLAGAGADVVVCSRSIEHCQESAAAISALGRRSVALECDVRSETAVQETVDRVLDEFGRIDILVNNAGAVWNEWPERTSLAGWQKVLDVNLTGTFLCCRAVAPSMIENGRGKIISISSVAAFGGVPPELANSIGYWASKGGLVTFTKDLAWKWGRYGINVNAIAPGWFPTDMTQSFLDEHADEILKIIPLERFGNESDLKGAVVFLASQASDFVSGHTLLVDGGQTA